MVEGEAIERRDPARCLTDARELSSFAPPNKSCPFLDHLFEDELPSQLRLAFYEPEFTTDLQTV
jgi:hypothetical protein